MTNHFLGATLNESVKLHFFHCCQSECLIMFCVYLIMLHWRKASLAYCSERWGAIITGCTTVLIQLFISVDMPSWLCYFLNPLTSRSWVRARETQSTLHFTAAWNIGEPKNMFSFAQDEIILCWINMESHAVSQNLEPLQWCFSNCGSPGPQSCNWRYTNSYFCYLMQTADIKLWKNW